MERPTRRRRRPTRHRLVCGCRLGTAVGTGRGLHLCAVRGAVGEQRQARRLPRIRTAARRRTGGAASSHVICDRPVEIRAGGRWSRVERSRRPREQRLGDRTRPCRGWTGRAVARQPPFPVGGRTALRRGATHRARPVRRLRREPARASRDRHRFHRRCRLDPHGVGRQADDRIQPDARPGVTDLLPRRRRAGADDGSADHDRRPARRRQRRHRDENAVAQ